MSITVVWRVRGENFDIAQFLLKHPELTPGRVWKKGERVRWKREPECDSGVNIPFCEHETLDEVMVVVRRWLTIWAKEFSALRKRGGQSELDFAIYVGVEDQFAVKICFEPRDLLRLARAGVSIAVSAYSVGAEEA